LYQLFHFRIAQSIIYGSKI
jgi:hypothetical protein